MEAKPIDFQREKLVVLIGLTLFWFISTLISLLATPVGPAYSVIFLLSNIGGGIGILYWCKIDADERRATIGTPLQIALVCFGIFALLYYLVTTRDGRTRLKAFAWLFLFTLCSYVIVVILVSVSLAVLKTAGIEMPEQSVAAEATAQ